MLKSILAGAAALAIAGGSLAYAQGPRGDRGPDRWKPNAEDASAFTDARIAALKAGLKLTPEQEKNWPAVETVLRDLAKQRVERRAARADDRNRDRDRDPIERLRERADRMTEAGTNLKKLVDAAQPLYQSLDDAQKRRFRVLSRMGLNEAAAFERDGRGWHHHRGPRGEGRGDGRGPGPRQ